MAKEIDVIGLEEALANLKRYGLIKREATKIILKEIGFKIEKQAKRNVPVWTGRLQSSISTNWSGSDLDRGKVGGKAKTADGVGRPEGESGMNVVVGTNVKYAHMQEWGEWGDQPKPVVTEEKLPTRQHEPTPRPPGGFMYLSRAYNMFLGELTKRVSEVLKKDIKQPTGINARSGGGSQESS